MWEKLKLSEVCQIGDGNHSSNYPKASEMVDHGIPFIRSGNIQNGFLVKKDLKFISPEKHKILKKGHLQEGDVLINNRGEIGKLAIVTEDFHGSNLNSQIAWLRPDDRLISSYLYYYLNSPVVSSSLYAQQTGTALQQLTIKRLKNIEIPIPPIEEQQSILIKLDKAYSEIDKAIKYEKSSLLLSQKLLANSLEKIFNQVRLNYDSSELLDVCEKIQDGAHNSPKKLYGKQNFNTFPYVTSKNVRTNFMNFEKIEYVDEIFHNSIYPRCNARRGDVLLTKDGANTGNICINEINEPISLLSSVCLIRGKENVLLNKYICFYLQSPTALKALTGDMTGTAIKRIILKNIKKTTIPIPPVEKQKELCSNIEDLLRQVKVISDAIDSKINNYYSLKLKILSNELSPK